MRRSIRSLLKRSRERNDHGLDGFIRRYHWREIQHLLAVGLNDEVATSKRFKLSIIVIRLHFSFSESSIGFTFLDHRSIFSITGSSSRTSRCFTMFRLSAASIGNPSFALSTDIGFRQTNKHEDQCSTNQPWVWYANNLIRQLGNHLRHDWIH